MIILLHGTGDDSSKEENWIRWVEVIMKTHGETVLTVAGVGSKSPDVSDDSVEDVGQNSIGPQALAFIEALGESVPKKVPKVDRILGMSSSQRNRYDYPKLLKALNEAGGKQFPKAAKVSAGQEEELIRELLAKKKKDGPAIGTGIKYRAAVASICAIAYSRRVRNPKPIRILGHSRGGSTAVAVHNILTYHGLDCDTLTLDPCHGKAKIFGNKDYYRKIWAGKLTNLPNKKNVKFDHMPDIFMCRPAITKGKGGCAEPINLPKLPKIKHGHMGKLRGFKEAEKESGRKELGRQIELWLATNNYNNPQTHLLKFFSTFITDKKSPVGKDRLTIAYYVVTLLTGAIPPRYTRTRRNSL